MCPVAKKSFTVNCSGKHECVKFLWLNSIRANTSEKFEHGCEFSSNHEHDGESLFLMRKWQRIAMWIECPMKSIEEIARTQQETRTLGWSPLRNAGITVSCYENCEQGMLWWIIVMYKSIIAIFATRKMHHSYLLLEIYVCLEAYLAALDTQLEEIFGRSSLVEVPSRQMETYLGGKLSALPLMSYHRVIQRVNNRI